MTQTHADVYFRRIKLHYLHNNQFHLILDNQFYVIHIHSQPGRMVDAKEPSHNLQNELSSTQTKLSR